MIAYLKPFQKRDEPSVAVARRGTPPGDGAEDLQRLLGDAVRKARHIGRRSFDAQSRGELRPEFEWSTALAAVLVYRRDGEFVAAYHAPSASAVIRNLRPNAARSLVRGIRQGTFIPAADMDRAALFYYVEPLQRRGASRLFMIGVLSGASLNAHYRLISDGVYREPSTFYAQAPRLSPWFFRGALFTLTLLTTVGLAVLALRLLDRRLVRSVDSLINLSRAYGQRRFGERSDLGSSSEFASLATALHGMAETLAQSDKELIRRERLEGALSRFFPPTQAAEIACGQRSIDWSGQRRIVSVLFVHVIGYSDFVRTAPPTEVVALLQELFGMVSELCFRQGGVMDKSVGDCMVALFGAHEQQEDHAQRALAAAEDIKRFIEAIAPRWQQEHSFEVELAIGISSGPAIVGDLGTEAGLEYTAIGEVVCNAARLAALALPGQVLVNGDVMEHISAPSQFDLKSVHESQILDQSTSAGASAVLELR